MSAGLWAGQEPPSCNRQQDSDPSNNSFGVWSGSVLAVTDDTVSFRWKDYRHGSQMRTLTLAVDEFLRRFLLHVLPKRFVRIRYFGLLAPRCHTDDLATSRTVLAVAPSAPVTAPSVSSTLARSWPCPRCGAPMRIVERLTARQLFLEALLADIVHDSS